MESPCNAGDLGSIPDFGKTRWRREWQPTPVFLPEEFHGQRSLAGYSPWSGKDYYYLLFIYYLSIYIIYYLSTIYDSYYYLCPQPFRLDLHEGRNFYYVSHSLCGTCYGSSGTLYSKPGLLLEKTRESVVASADYPPLPGAEPLLLKRERGPAPQGSF